MAIQNDNTLVTKGDLKELYTDKIAPYLGGGINYYHTDRSGQELLSAYAKLASSWTATVNSNVPLVLKSGNIIQSSTGLFTIPDGTRVEIIFSTSSNPVGDTSYSLYNNTDSAYISDITNIDPYKGDNYLNSTVLSAQWTNNTGHSVDISIRASRSSATSTLIGHTSLTIKEIGRIVDPIQYTANNDELEETPVGNIISYMGNSVPKHHLACDGTEYAIGTYPELEAHIIKEFGSINYFGGDGTTTWAVPDLNGEFLRGTGTNSHTNQGSGASVGEHQDATEELDTAYSTKYNYRQMVGIRSEVEYETAKNVDSYITNADSGFLNEKIGTFTSNPNARVAYTARPTNTSVLYCIKYESTYHVIVPSHMYKVNIPFSTVASTSSVYATFDPTNIIGDTSLVDTTNNQFIAPMHGWYSVSFNTSQGSSRKCPAIYLEKYEGGTKIEEIAMANGFNTGEDYYSGTISTTVYLKKNQTIKYRVHNTGALSGEASFCLLTANYKDNIIAGGEVYSFEEQLVGTNTDGRPLYQKTIISTLPSANADKDLDIGASVQDGWVYTAYVHGDYNASLMDDYWYVYVGKNNSTTPNKLRIHNSLAGWADLPVTVTIQYTKTTDTAGTYQYKNSLLLTRPDMWEPNTEYDFGGGLYGRRFSGTISQSGNTLSMLSLGSIGIRQIINCGGNWYHGTEYVSLNGTNEGYQSSGLIMSNNSLSLRTFSDQTRTNAPYDIWVTYKK